MLLPSLLALLALTVTSKLHDSDVSGVCAINWDEIDDQLALDNSVCCDDKLHRELYRSLSKLNQKHANSSEVLSDVVPLIPKDVDAHVVATEGVLAISAPGLGTSFCKQRVGAVHVLIQQSPISEPMGLSIPAERAAGCNHPALSKKVAALIQEWKMPGKLSGAQMVKIFAKHLYAEFTTRIWLALSEKRVAFRSNAQLACEFPVGDRLHLTVFTFQPLPSSSSIEMPPSAAAGAGAGAAVAADDAFLAAAERSEAALLPAKLEAAPASDFSLSEPSTVVVTSTVAPSTTVAQATVAPFSPRRESSSFQKLNLLEESSSEEASRRNGKSRSEGIFKRQSGGGRARLGGCGNEKLKEIMERVLSPLLTLLNMKLGDIAQRLQGVVQQTTGKSFEIFLGKGDMATASHQMDQKTHCRVRIGNHYSTIYETPVQYDIRNSELEKRLSNIDFGEPLGGSGFPGQKAFSHFSDLVTHLGDGRLNMTMGRFGGGGPSFPSIPSLPVGNPFGRFG